MKTRLTLQEKLRDLREERKLKLADVSKATGIPVSTLQRIEGQDDTRTGYQDIATLAKFYNVSTDYLFGLTDNRQFRNIDIDLLHLTDEVVEVLKSGELNNRLICELITNTDFRKLLSAVEVYIDRKVLPQMNTMNAMYKLAETTIKENYDVDKNDETMAFLQQAMIDEDDYLRYRISERFNSIMKNMFEIHKKDALPGTQNGIVEEMKRDMQEYLSYKDNPERGKLIVFAKKIGLNLNKLSDEQIEVLVKALQTSEKYRKSRKRI